MPVRCVCVGAALWSLAACSPATPPPAPAERDVLSEGVATSPPAASGVGRAVPPAVQAACNAAQASPLIGQPPDPDVVRRAAQLAGASTTRVVAHGQPVDADFSYQRLNVLLAPNGRIRAFSCG